MVAVDVCWINLRGSNRLVGARKLQSRIVGVPGVCT